MRNQPWRLLTATTAALFVSVVLSAGVAAADIVAKASVDTVPPVAIGTVTVCVDYDPALIEPRFIDPQDASQGLETVTYPLAVEFGGVVIASDGNPVCPGDAVAAVTGIFLDELTGTGDLMGIVFDRLAGAPGSGLDSFSTGQIESFLLGEPIPPEDQPEISVVLVPEPAPGALAATALATLLYVGRLRGARDRRVIPKA
jgi:hypothetical protein